MLNHIDPEKIQPYITRIAYLRMESFYQTEEAEYLNYNTMLWEKEMFFKNKDKLKQIKRWDNYEVYELKYHDYRSFFIIDKIPWRGFTRVFFVNILKSDTSYDGYENESIMIYKAPHSRLVENHIKVNKKRYKAIHIGNMFNKYRELKQTRVTERMLWEDVQKFCRGEATSLHFDYSLIGEFMIVHSVFEVKNNRSYY